jgi:hypothetical protein
LELLQWKPHLRLALLLLVLVTLAVLHGWVDFLEW